MSYRSYRSSGTGSTRENTPGVVLSHPAEHSLFFLCGLFFMFACLSSSVFVRMICIFVSLYVCMFEFLRFRTYDSYFCIVLFCTLHFIFAYVVFRQT